MQSTAHAALQARLLEILQLQDRSLDEGCESTVQLQADLIAAATQNAVLDEGAAYDAQAVLEEATTNALFFAAQARALLVQATSVLEEAALKVQACNARAVLQHELSML